MHYFGKGIIALVLVHGLAFGQFRPLTSSFPDTPVGKFSLTRQPFQVITLDKFKHFTSSIMLVTTSGYYLGYTNFSAARIRNYSMGLTFSLGIIKEVSDHYRTKGHASWGDIVADGAGMICGGIILHNLRQ